MQVAVLIGAVAGLNVVADEVAILRLRPIREVLKNRQWVREYGPSLPIWFFDSGAKKMVSSVQAGDSVSIRYELQTQNDAVHIHALEFVNLSRDAK